MQRELAAEHAERLVRGHDLPSAFGPLLAGLSDETERTARAEALASELQSARTSLGPTGTQPAADPAPTEPPAPVEDPYPEPENRELLATIEMSGPDGATPPEIPSSQPDDKLAEEIRGTESLTDLEQLQRDLSRR